MQQVYLAEIIKPISLVIWQLATVKKINRIIIMWLIALLCGYKYKSQHSSALIKLMHCS